MSEWIAAIETLLVSSQIVLVFVVPRASPPCRLISSTHQCQSNSADFAFYRRARVRTKGQGVCHGVRRAQRCLSLTLQPSLVYLVYNKRQACGNALCIIYTI
jgi:hypothetical protein